MQVITSKDNEIVKTIKKLKEKKYRDLNGQFIVEGIKMVAEAIEEKADIDTIVICEDCVNDGTIDKKLLYEIAKYKCVYVKKNVFDFMSDVTNPQGILAVINKNQSKNSIRYDEDIIVILDGIQDPGNLGTILRTIDSAGLKQVVISNETADCYNPKVVRSTMGGIFRVNVVRCDDLLDKINEVKKNGYKVVVTSLGAKESIYTIDYNKKAIVIGNEANGVSKEVMDLADEKVIIPMLGKTESLNAGVATGIIIYEYVRRKVNSIK